MSRFVSDVRRSLQREYLGLVEPLVRFQPGTLLSADLHAMVKHSLRTLATRLDEVLGTGKLDFASEAHLRACKSRIDRMLAPELKEIRPVALVATVKPLGEGPEGTGSPSLPPSTRCVENGGAGDGAAYATTPGRKTAGFLVHLAGVLW